MISSHHTYKSNVQGLGAELNAKLERIVARAARDGASKARQLSSPSVPARGNPADTTAGLITAAVTVPRTLFWAQMLDSGTLGRRTIPLKYPGKRKASWKAKRRRKGQRATSLTDGGYVVSQKGSNVVTYHRRGQALASGGIHPQYFFIRGKRHAQQQLGKYLIRGL